MKTHRIAVLLVSLCSLAVSSAAADDETEKLVAFLKGIDATVQEDGIPAAVKKIESLGDSTQVMRNYFIVTSHYYRNQRDIDGMLAFGQAGMKYLLAEAAKVRETDAARAAELEGFAKSMAYNISANAWPGWNEPGITITREHSKAAMRAACNNLRLGRKLERPDDVIGNAHWLMGAQHLALKQPDQAIEHFEKAIDRFSAAEKPDYQHMAAGYIGIAQLTRAESHDDGRKTLDKALADLAARKTSDARFFIGQLKAVEKVFVGLAEMPTDAPPKP